MRFSGFVARQASQAVRAARQFLVRRAAMAWPAIERRAEQSGRVGGVVLGCCLTYH